MEAVVVAPRVSGCLLADTHTGARRRRRERKRRLRARRRRRRQRRRRRWARRRGAGRRRAWRGRWHRRWVLQRASIHRCAHANGAQALHLAGCSALVGLAVVAEPSVVAAPPALDATTDQGRAGLGEAGRDGDGAGAEVDGAQARHLTRRVALAVRAVVAEPPAAAVAPALDAAAVEDRAGVAVAGRLRVGIVAARGHT